MRRQIVRKIQARRLTAFSALIISLLIQADAMGTQIVSPEIMCSRQPSDRISIRQTMGNSSIYLVLRTSSEKISSFRAKLTYGTPGSASLPIGTPPPISKPQPMSRPGGISMPTAISRPNSNTPKQSYREVTIDAEFDGAGKLTQATRTTSSGQEKFSGSRLTEPQIRFYLHQLDSIKPSWASAIACCRNPNSYTCPVVDKIDDP